jgi:hypothetical protein
MARFGADGVKGGFEKPAGILGEPEFVLVGPRRQPFEKIDAYPSPERVAHHAHLGQEIPELGSLMGGGTISSVGPLIALAS